MEQDQADLVVLSVIWATERKSHPATLLSNLLVLAIQLFFRQILCELIHDYVLPPSSFGGKLDLFLSYRFLMVFKKLLLLFRFI